MGLPCDWQVKKQKFSERAEYLLLTGQWSDCKFVVGQDPHQQILNGHKLFLAMSSPVFEAMFYGSMAEKNDPIPIQDVQPEAFKALLKYIYTDSIELGSFELACELCYCAKKYMLPFLVEECTKYLWADLSPKKTCRAYEFAKLFEEPVLMDKCLQIICSRTNEVLKESSWEDVELTTLTTILEQDELQIDSEMELFNAIERWAKAECNRKSLDSTDAEALKSVIGNALSKIRFLTMTPQEFAEGPGCSLLLTKNEAFGILVNIICSGNGSGVGNKVPMPEGFSSEINTRTKQIYKSPSMNFDISRLRQVTSPQNGGFHQWSSVPSTSFSQFLANNDAMGTSRNTSPIIIEGGMKREPGGNSVMNNSSGMMVEGSIRDGPKYYCLRSVLQQTECLNTSVLDCSLTFNVDKNICVIGVQVPTQIAGASPNLTLPSHPDSTYTEILYASLHDSDGTRLTYTHFTTKANFGTLVEITFNRPVYIQKHKIYKVAVGFNKVGWYPMGMCTQNMTCDAVFFSFGVGNSVDNVRDGLIRSIVFTCH